MPSLAYHDLPPSDLPQLGSIDRAERVDAIYLQQDGNLELRAHVEDVSGWDPAELAQYVARLRDVRGAGGAVLGAWDGGRLVGLASLDPRAVGGDPVLMKLDMLYVDAAHRGRGIGTRLVALIGARARSHGAAALYVSATPTRRTVDFYRGLGAQVLASPDPALLEKEPADIHMVLRLEAGSARPSFAP